MRHQHDLYDALSGLVQFLTDYPHPSEDIEACMEAAEMALQRAEREQRLVESLKAMIAALNCERRLSLPVRVARQNAIILMEQIQYEDEVTE